jgi:hypothetical protein
VKFGHTGFHPASGSFHATNFLRAKAVPISKFGQSSIFRPQMALSDPDGHLTFMSQVL